MNNFEDVSPYGVKKKAIDVPAKIVLVQRDIQWMNWIALLHKKCKRDMMTRCTENELNSTWHYRYCKAWLRSMSRELGRGALFFPSLGWDDDEDSLWPEHHGLTIQKDVKWMNWEDYLYWSSKRELRSMSRAFFGVYIATLQSFIF